MGFSFLCKVIDNDFNTNIKLNKETNLSLMLTYYLLFFTDTTVAGLTLGLVNHVLILGWQPVFTSCRTTPIASSKIDLKGIVCDLYLHDTHRSSVLVTKKTHIDSARAYSHKINYIVRVMRT